MTITLAIEDSLSEAVGRKLIKECCPHLTLHSVLGRRGNGYLRSKIRNFDQIARIQPVLVITDLDRVSCPAELLKKWAGNDTWQSQLLVRVAVREIESWILADHESLHLLFEYHVRRLPMHPDTLDDPKHELLNLAQDAPRLVRDDLCKSRSSVSSQGIGYNVRLSTFVAKYWVPSRAAERSGSLNRACTRLQHLGRL